MAFDFDNFLTHYGVPGMKWGIRRNSTGSIGGPNLQTLAVRGIKKGVAAQRARKALPSSADHRKVSTLRKKPTRTLTNKQIKEINNRLEMEKRLSQLKIENSKLTKSNNTVKAVLAVAATGVAIHTLATSSAGKAAIELGKKIISGS